MYAGISQLTQSCRSLKRERDQLQQRFDAQEQADPSPQPKPTKVAQQLQEVQAELAAAQEQLQVRSLCHPIPVSPTSHQSYLFVTNDVALAGLLDKRMYTPASPLQIASSSANVTLPVRCEPSMVRMSIMQVCSCA